MSGGSAWASVAPFCPAGAKPGGPKLPFASTFCPSSCASWISSWRAFCQNVMSSLKRPTAAGVAAALRFGGTVLAAAIRFWSICWARDRSFLMIGMILASSSGSAAYAC
jgi:hypothetical protein